MTLNSSSHPALRYDLDLARAQSRARGAMGALSVTAVVRLASIPVMVWQSGLVRDLQAGNSPPYETLQLSDNLVRISGILELGLYVVTAVLFLRWLHLTVRLTRALGEVGVLAPKDAVASFIIPFVSFIKPYSVVRDLHDRLAPDGVPEPLPRVLPPDEATGYREVKIETPPPPQKLPHASIGAWWFTFWAGGVLGYISSRMTGTDLSDLLARNTFYALSDAADVVSAVLAVVVVRAITARLVERYRRILHTPEETLAPLGISVE